MAQVPQVPQIPMTEETTPCDPVRQPKHSVLFGLYYQLNEVVLRVDSLNSQLGVYNNKPPGEEKAQTKDAPAPDTLVEVVDRLPGMIGGQLSDLHSLLNQLEDSLI